MPEYDAAGEMKAIEDAQEPHTYVYIVLQLSQCDEEIVSVYRKEAYAKEAARVLNDKRRDYSLEFTVEEWEAK